MKYKKGQRVIIINDEDIYDFPNEVYTILRIDEKDCMYNVYAECESNTGEWLNSDDIELAGGEEETFEEGEMVDVRDHDDECWYRLSYAGKVHAVFDREGDKLFYKQIRKAPKKVTVCLDGVEQEVSEELMTLIKKEVG